MFRQIPRKDFLAIVAQFAKERARKGERFSDHFERIVQTYYPGEDQSEQGAWDWVANRAADFAFHLGLDSLAAGKWLDSFSVKKDLVLELRAPDGSKPRTRKVKVRITRKAWRR